MAKILAFAGSNSSTSINYELVKHTVSLLENHQVQSLNMSHFPFPLYGEDYEKENGFSNSLIELKDDIAKSDGLIISVNEHNGNPSAYFKNLIDWLSRLEKNFLDGKPVFLMSTSGGKRGGASSLDVTKSLLPRFGAEVITTFSLPSFQKNFDKNKGIVDAELTKTHSAALSEFLAKL